MKFARLGAALACLLTAAAVRADYPRRTPIVEAVQKTRAAVLTIRARRGETGAGRESIGTGVVVDERGFIVTNAHVVDGAGRVSVEFADHAELPAQVVAADAESDLAVLSVNAGRLLPALVVGPSSDLMVGEPVIAVGHPYGYTNTVSTGIVSAVGRNVTMPSGRVLHDLIQTDAGINPGNSGGPLLNVNGELIGINVALREGAQGIAFAVSAETLKDALGRHLAGARVAGVRHGLTCAERVAAEGSGRQHVVITGVEAGAPAAAAGLRAGDEIVRVADRAVQNRFDVERSLWGRKPGESVHVRIARAGREIDVALWLAPADQLARPAAIPPAGGHPSEVRAASTPGQWSKP